MVKIGKFGKFGQFGLIGQIGQNWSKLVKIGLKFFLLRLRLL